MTNKVVSLVHSMAEFRNNEVRIHYQVHGEGSPVLFLHGVVVDFNYNFEQFGWVEALNEKGFQVIGMDFRGHGETDKSSDPAFYGLDNLCDDVMSLLTHLQLEKVSLVGYSLGSAVGLNLLHRHPSRFSKGVLMATGDGLMGLPPYIFDEMFPGFASIFAHEKFPDHLPSHLSAYWTFMEENDLKREHIRAFASAKYPSLEPEKVSTIQVPTLVVSGEKDLVLGTGANLADALPYGEYLELSAINHFTLAASYSGRDDIIKFLSR